LNYSYTASLCEALVLSTCTNVSQFVSQYDVLTEFLLSIGEVGKVSVFIPTSIISLSYIT
jgi:hypothetical protein